MGGSATVSPQWLRRQVGLFGAVALGLGSILGTGVFVSLALATGLAGPSVIVAVALAGLVAILLYYAITNLAALRLPKDARMYPRTLAYGGLAACLFLTVWIDRTTWLAGGGLILLGLLWHYVARRRAQRRAA